MSWTAPVTWAPGHMVNAAEMNAQVRDNFTYLKQRVDDDGSHRHNVYSFGLSAGVGNTGSGWTTCYAYDLTIPGGLVRDGEALQISGVASVTATLGDRRVACRIDATSGGSTLVYGYLESETAATANTAPFEFLFIRRSSTTGAAVGWSYKVDPRGPMEIVIGTSGHDWTVDQVLRWWVYSSVATNNVIILMDVHVQLFGALSAKLV